jgi:hypothetical protein
MRIALLIPPAQVRRQGAVVGVPGLPLDTASSSRGQRQHGVCEREPRGQVTQAWVDARGLGDVEQTFGLGVVA